MKKNKFFILISFVVCVASCVTTNKSSNGRPKLQLSDVEQLRIGVSQSSELSKTFGTPDKKISLPYSEDEEAWLYFEAPLKATPRLTLILNKSTGSLNRVTWWVRQQDPENDLNKIKSKYLKSDFVSTPRIGENPHFISDEVIYSARNGDLFVVYREATNKVQSINWKDPKARSIAGNQKEKKPQFEWSP